MPVELDWKQMYEQAKQKCEQLETENKKLRHRETLTKQYVQELDASLLDVRLQLHERLVEIASQIKNTEARLGRQPPEIGT